MPLHPAAELLIERFAESGLGHWPGITPEERRAAMNSVIADGARIKPVYAVEDLVAPGPAGEIPLRAYRPAPEALPVVVWLHGGGWVTGSIETHDLLCRQIAVAAGAMVVSVEYRLAPETKFPGAVEDCLAAWQWIGAHAAEIGGDADRVALGGDSAGGNLAAVVALLARDRGLPAPVHQLLVYPVTDHEFERPSMVDNATGYYLEADSMRWFFDHYARTADDFDDWRMSPLRAPDLSGLPGAVVITAEYDPLRDQGEAYGRQMQEAGVPVRIVRADGLFHGFFGLQKFLPPAQEPWDVAIGALRCAFAED